MDKLEKVVWVVTGLLVAVVILFVVVGPLKSEISEKTIGYEFGRLNPTKVRFQPPAPGRVPTPAGPASFAPQSGGGRAGDPAGTTRKPKVVDGKPVPGAPDEHQPPPPFPPGGPGIVVGDQEVVLPQSMVDKYKHFEDIVDLGMSAYGEDVTLADGTTAFSMKEIAEDSPLSTRLGFQPGDVVISVNGFPASKGEARGLYDKLRNDRTFNVVIERQGQRMTMTYRIQ